MQRGLFRYDVTACETKVFICFSIYYLLLSMLLFSSGLVMVFNCFSINYL